MNIILFNCHLLFNEDKNNLLVYSHSELMSLDDFLGQENTMHKQMERFTNAKAKKVLKYMFPKSMAEAMNLWFGKSSETDDYIRYHFETMVCEARDGKYDHWIRCPIECLALIILLDQFPRHIYRHKVFR